MKCKKQKLNVHVAFVSVPLLSEGKKEKYGLKGSALSLEAIPCRGIGCKVKFLPIWRDQGFHSPDCKSKYFTLARKLGDVLLKAHAVEVNSIEGEPEAYEIKCNGQVFRLKPKLKRKREDDDDQAPSSFGDKKRTDLQT